MNTIIMAFSYNNHSKLFYLSQIVKLARLSIAIAVLPCFFLGVLFAMAVGAEFILENVIWGFTILFLIEIAAAYANDYFDYEGDKYNKQFGFSGGSGVLLEHPELRMFAKWAGAYFKKFPSRFQRTPKFSLSHDQYIIKALPFSAL